MFKVYGYLIGSKSERTFEIAEGIEFEEALQAAESEFGSWLANYLPGSFEVTELPFGFEARRTRASGVTWGYGVKIEPEAGETLFTLSEILGAFELLEAEIERDRGEAAESDRFLLADVKRDITGILSGALVLEREAAPMG